ncbi:unnamed protein product [Caenorhabditis brenneri]
MPTTLMSLECLKFLLQYMDANRRFEISNRCPALRAIEKYVPLKINSLILSKQSVIINDTTYRIGVIRKYIVGDTPEWVTASNERGGIPHDMDEYGIRVSDFSTLTPGDLDIDRLWRLAPRQENDDGTMRFLEIRIQQYEGELAERRERRPSASRDTEKENLLHAYRERLFAYQCRQNNVSPNYEHFLQLTKTQIVDKQERKTIQRYTHNKKYSETMKQLTTVLFAGRVYPILVTKVEFNCTFGVIRLPVGLKLKIDRLMFRGTTLEALAPVIHESSFPLEKIDLNIESADDLTNPIVRTAEFLKVRFLQRNDLQNISTITNPLVYIRWMNLSIQVLRKFVGHWLESQRPVGYEYIFDGSREPRFAVKMEEILKKLNGVPVDEENVIIPMSAVTQLKISYGPFPEFSPRSKWAVRFLTEAVEH